MLICVLLTEFGTNRSDLEDGHLVLQRLISSCKLATAKSDASKARQSNLTVSRDFAIDVCKLPASAAENNFTEYMKFLDTWGTVRT